MIPSRKGFPFPLPLYALEGFLYPRAGSVFAAAHWHEGEVMACNGHVALRALKGAWLPEDFAPPAAEFLERFLGLPWEGRITQEEFSTSSRDFTVIKPLSLSRLISS